MLAVRLAPTLWLFVTEYRNNLIIHFGLLLESKQDSYGHDLCGKYNVINLARTIQNLLYFYLSTNAFPHWILISS